MTRASNAWGVLLGATAEPLREFGAALGDPEGAQRRLLRRILCDARGTAFAAEHGLDGCDDVETFRKRVPIRDYAQMSGYVSRIADGEPDVLVRGRPLAFERTGGSSSGQKLIPYGQAALTAFRRSSLAWLGDLAARRPGVAQGRAYLALSQPRPAERTPGGTPIGMGSDAAYLGADLAAAAADIVVAPVLEDDCDASSWRARTAAALCECEDLAFVSVWSPTFLLTVLDALTTEHEAVASRLSRPARLRLERAAADGGVAVLWPRLACVSCWTDGASAAFARRLATALPGVAIAPKGLVSTEAVVTVPSGAGEGAPPALPWTFLEFVDEAGAARLSHQLNPGARYGVVTTTTGGLFRYDSGDLVECVAVERGVPRLSFAGRRDRTSDMVGEKLDDPFVSRALAVVGFPCALVPRGLDKPRYDLIVECPGGQEDEAARRADIALRENPQYAFARDFGQLCAPVARRIESFSAALAAAAERRGLRVADAKPSGIVHKELAEWIVMTAQSSE